MATENKTRNNGSKLRYYTLENTKAEMVHHKFRDFSFIDKRLAEKLRQERSRSPTELRGKVDE